MHDVPPNPIPHIYPDLEWARRYKADSVVRALTDLLGTPGSRLATAERTRQIEVEGIEPSVDARQTEGLLEAAAISYLEAPFMRGATPHTWPWSDDSWKPTPDDRRRELVKAAALAIAAVDRELAQR